MEEGRKKSRVSDGRVKGCWSAGQQRQGQDRDEESEWGQGMDKVGYRAERKTSRSQVGCIA